MIDRRQFVAAALSTAAMPSAFAQTTWEPTRNIQIIVGFQAGGGTDVIAASTPRRRRTDRRQVHRRQPSGRRRRHRGRRRGAQRADGYTMLLGGGSESTTQPHYVKLNYKLEDFRAVGRVNREHMVLVTSSKGQLKSVDDIVKRAKQEPGKIVYGSSGGRRHPPRRLPGFERAAGIELNHVPYRGGADAFKTC